MTFRYKIIIISLIIFLANFVILLLAGLRQTSGHFGYPLDDTYIHLAMARHFAEHGEWGVSLYGFSSSTSSPLWTLLLGLIFKVTAIHDLIPSGLCLLIGALAIIFITLLLQEDFSSSFLMGLLICIIILSPMAILALTGLEHLLHALFSFLLMFLVAGYLTKNKINSIYYFLLGIVSAFIPVTRYEGIFLIASASLLFLINKRLSAAIFIAISGAVPVIFYGLISLKNGWFFLPNPVLLKSQASSFFKNPILFITGRFTENLLKCPQLLLVLFIFILYTVGLFQKRLDKKVSSLVFIFLISTALHYGFAQTGWFYRYEAYLLFIGLPVATYLKKVFCPENLKREKNISRPATLAISVIIILSAFTLRAFNAYKSYPGAVKNIYEQQYQMGLFLRQYYEGSVIAANDIGAINYLANVYTLDLAGLASREVLKARIKNEFNLNFLHSFVLSKKAEIIIIYRSWFYPHIPSDWIEIGRWRIKNNVVCGSDEGFLLRPFSHISRKSFSEP